MKLLDTILENIELDEWVIKTDQERIEEFKKKFPNYDYSDAKIYKDGKALKIKNIKCKIHNHNFPEEGRPEGIELKKHLDGIGCRDCGKESLSKKASERFKKTDKQWREVLSKFKNLKDKCDFSKSKISFIEPMTYGPLVSNIYCKIHKKFFNGGPNNEGFRTNSLYNAVNLCPDCRKENYFNNSAKYFEDWIIDFKSNNRNKNYDYSESEVFIENDKKGARVYNINCKVKGLNGEKHGFFAKDGIDASQHSMGYEQCPKCSCENKQREFIKDSTKIHGNKYLYDMVDYCDPSSIIKKQGLNKINTYRNVLIGCKEPKHGYFFQLASNHRRGKGCPICRESKGELYIGNLLSKLKIKFIKEKKFTESGNMEFDFYIPKLKVLIEYDGEQHFFPVFGSSDYTRNLNYNKAFTNDNIKNKFVKSNPYGVRLIRIPYTMEFNEIDTLLLEAIENTSSNQIKYLGNYPKRQGRKEPAHKDKINLNESKLSLIGILNQLSSNE